MIAIVRLMIFTALTVLSNFVFSNLVYAHATKDFLVWDNVVGLRPVSSCTLRNQNSTLSGSLKNLDHLVVEITDLEENSPTAPFPILGSLWYAANDNGSTLSLLCSEAATSKEYLLYDVFLPNRQEPIARVGVAYNEGSLFKFVRTYSVDSTDLIASNSSSTQLKTASITEGVNAVEGDFDQVVCVISSAVNVRDQSLNNILFTVKPYDSVKVVQSFGTDRVQKSIGGTVYTFVKAQFPSRSGSPNIGWIAENFVVLRAQCEGAPKATPAPEAVIAGWTFPVSKRTTLSYKSGMRSFKASRAGGRLHAACDLYRTTGEPVLSANSGTVIRDRYYFYQGTYAIEVRHTDGKVIRYGEITGKAAIGIGLNKNVSSGQTIGYVGKVNSNCCEPMLHFEMYSGSATGALTQSGNSFNRRKDLIDPSNYLTDWEKAKFGVSF